MEHHRLRKYRGPETWARVRQAYIAGESAPSLVRRFDVGYANLRRRARIEGWTRKVIAEKLDLKPIRGGADEPDGPWRSSDPDEAAPPMDPHEALSEAVRRAAGLLSRGRTEEATVLLRAATALEKLRWVGGYGRTSV